jgi:hypothetical protein
MFALRSSYLLLSVALLAGPSNAALLTYSNTMSGADYSDTYTGIRNLWQGALTSMATVTFDDVGTGFFNNTTLVYDTSNNTFYNSSSPTLNATSIQVFRNVSGSSSRLVWNGAPPIPSSSNRYFEGEQGAGNYIQITLPTPTTATITAVALDLWTYSLAGQDVTVRVYDAGGSLVGTYTLPTNNNSTAAFFGITSDAALGFLRISSTSGRPMLANVDFGVAATGQQDPPPNTETPESATLGYVGIGVVAILFGTNRKLRRASAAN